MSGDLRVDAVVDRVSPAVRPDRPVVMRQDWHHLLFLHWAVPPEEIRPLVPEGLDLDLYEGRAYVGLTPFTMTGVRPVGVPPLPLVSHFHETNVRTYVHRAGRDPGVWFLSLDASSRLAVLGARLAMGLPYKFARIGFTCDESGPTIDYALERRWPGPLPATLVTRYAPRGEPGLPRLGTLEYFLVERYVLYTVWSGRLYRGRIHHPPVAAPGRGRPAARRVAARRGPDRAARGAPARALRARAEGGGLLHRAPRVNLGRRRPSASALPPRG